MVTTASTDLILIKLFAGLTEKFFCDIIIIIKDKLKSNYDERKV